MVDVNAHDDCPDCPEWIFDLYQEATGTAIAADPVKRVQLLSQAIPSLSTPVGQKNLASLAEAGRNYDMPQLYGSSHWPRVEPSQNIIPWHHSDIRDVGYLYVAPFFDQITAISNQ